MSLTELEETNTETLSHLGDDSHKDRINEADRVIAGVAGSELKQFIARIDRLEEEKLGVMEDIKEVYAEAKGRGYEPKVIKLIRKLRDGKIASPEEFATAEVYVKATGMQLELPLFEDDA